MKDRRLSIALATRNRPDSLKRTLTSLRNQSVQPLEVVISDDSEPELISATKELARDFDCIYTSGPRRGLYANRNHAALACKGSHVRTMDDDHEFPVGHFADCSEALNRDSESVWIIGEFLPTETPQLGARVPGELHPRGFSVRPKNPDNCWGFSDGASILPAEIFKRGVRYADFFKFGAGYLEFGSRLYWLGYRLRTLTTTYVIHHYNFATRSFANQQMDLSSRMFAGMCHSFIYQANSKNKLLCVAEIGRRIVLHHGWEPFRMAEIEFRKHRSFVSR